MRWRANDPVSMKRNGFDVDLSAVRFDAVTLIESLRFLLIPAILVSGLAGCASQPAVSLPPTATPPEVLRAYTVEELLVHHEGLRLTPYLDTANKWTIGVGRNLSDSGISQDEAFYLLNHDLQRVSRELDQNLPWWRELSEVRQKVMVSMAFNLGMSGLLGFHEMLSAAEGGDYSGAARHMLGSRWAAQVGRRAVELAYLMENG